MQSCACATARRCSTRSAGSRSSKADSRRPASAWRPPTTRLRLAQLRRSGRYRVHLEGLGEPTAWKTRPHAAREPGAREGSIVLVGDISRSDLSPALRERMRQLGIKRAGRASHRRPRRGPCSALYSAEPQEFDRDEIDLLERLTREIDYAVDFIAKSERLEYLAYHNPVTGLPNRSAFRERAAAAAGAGRRWWSPWSTSCGSATSTIRAVAASATSCCARSATRLQQTAGADAIVAHPEAGCIPARLSGDRRSRGGGRASRCVARRLRPRAVR